VHGAVAPAAQVATGELEAKLGLAEFLLASADLQVSARRAVDWLIAQTSIKHAVVILADPSTHQLVIVAEHGVSSSAIADFVLTRDDEAHPLIKAMHRRDPTYFDKPQLLFRAPIAGRFHGLPLCGDEGDPPCGLLLTSAATPKLRAEVTWLAGLLSKQVARLMSRDTLAETRFGQERMLLYSIINAVTDPILLTDTEGKLIIANSHAEKLFAAPEDASEGWRRAVSLNNMLFSAALSTSAVADSELARRELLLVDPLEGSDLLFELLSSRAKDERQGTYVVSVLRNVTDLARAKEEIEESYRTLRVSQAEVRDERHRLELIIDSVADPILVTDQEGDIVLLNEPAERLFNIPGTADEGAQRHVRANGAHLTSFVSNVLTTTGEQRYRGEIQLSDPVSGRPLPVEGVAGTILSE
jgi:PAS domain-containing protein